MTHIGLKRLTPLKAGLLLLFLAACTLRIGSATRTSDAPAPTTVPLAATAAPLPRSTIVPTEHPIALPHGFAISVFVQGLDNPRMLAIGPDGVLYVAERGAGRILRLPDRDGDGLADSKQVVAQGLNAPSSLAFYQDGSLYVAETRRVLRLSNPDAQGIFQNQAVIVADLPSGGHSTRTVLFSPDESTLFVSIGSSCNVCIEEDQRRAAIMAYNPDGSNERLYARGLRNAVGITFRPGTSELWATNNGRDMLGDDLPPETIDIVHQGDDFGWPRCHSGRIIDPDFGDSQSCQGVKAPVVEMQAHSAPLGLAFYTGSQFPEAYRDDLFVAFHGSWNRSVPTGYKLVRIPMQDGQPGPVQDFATGWLLPNGSNWGRPVDVITGNDGSLYLSDDAGGKIYRIFYTGN
ncbi:MAG: sorbosone dehydrogenase family protein [Anaerolineales bacterium]